MPKVALAVSVSAAVTLASATVAKTLARPVPLVIAEGALSFTRPPDDANATCTPGTGLPPASLTTALKVAAPVEPRSVVELIVKLTVETLPATVKLAMPCTVAAPSLATATTWSAPLCPPLAAASVALALPLASVASDAALSVASVPRTVLRSTRVPGTGLPLASRTVTVTVAGLAVVIVADEMATVTDAKLDVCICKTVCAVTVTPPTVALAVIWSAPLLVAVRGVTATCAIPLAFVPTVSASNALRPNDEPILTTVPAPTARPVASFTRIDRMAGWPAVTLLALAVKVIVGVSASSCTATEDCTNTEPTVALAVRVSAAVTLASATATVMLASPASLVTADGAPRVTRLPTDVKATCRLATGLPMASLTEAVNVAAPVEPFSVVELIFSPTDAEVPATVKLAVP